MLPRAQTGCAPTRADPHHGSPALIVGAVRGQLKIAGRDDRRGGAPGDPTPSRADRRLTQQPAEGARLLDFRLHDHIIIGNGTLRWVSLAQRGAISVM